MDFSSVASSADRLRGAFGRDGIALPAGRLRIQLGGKTRSFGLSSGVTLGEVAQLLEDLSAREHKPATCVDWIVSSNLTGAPASQQPYA
jgi:hypothetical protein